MTIIHVMEPFASGITTAVINIIEELQDFEHIVIHGSRTSDNSIETVQKRFNPNTKFILWKTVGREINLKNDIKAFFELQSYLKDHKDAIVHLHSSKAGFLGRIACWSLGIKKVIYTPHCGSFLRTDVSYTKRLFFRTLEKIASFFGGLVVGCGKSEGELYKNLGRNTTYVNNGTNTSYKVDMSKKKMQIVFAGIINTQKNPAMFNEIAKILKDTNDAQFIWVGDGELKYYLTSKNILVTGWLPKQKVDEYLIGSSIYLSTSNWEGLPFGVIEAMNAGCALVLHDVPGNRDLVINGENGYLFKNADEAVNILNKLLKNKEIVDKMGLKSIEIVKNNYSRKQMGEGYKNIYLTI